MGQLAAVLGQCASLTHLDLSANNIGDEGAGRLAAGLGQCASLAYLNLERNAMTRIELSIVQQHFKVRF